MIFDQDLNNRNQQASDPKASVWVTANAGSGKTHLLVDRAIRLLLEGTPPERILCLTFTKAAASEMAERLFDRLSEWIAMPEAELTAAIVKITGTNSASLGSARRLFAQALETPGGLKIQTIHAFCERLLQRFPLEAGVVPGFSVLDDQASEELLAQMRQEVLQSQTHAALIDDVVGRANPDDFDKLLAELFKAKADLEALPEAETLKKRLCASLSLPQTDLTALDIITHWLQARDVNWWRDLIEPLQASGKTDQQRASEAEIIALGQNPELAFAMARKFFLTGDGIRRNAIISKSFLKNHPHFEDGLEQAYAQFEAHDELLASLVTYQASLALISLAKAILTRFTQEKRKRGQYGYDDLIEKARFLLQSTKSDWVLYKLDGGLDHILIDEAQDTSPAQWQVIEHLTQEFFAGSGARTDIVRTLFVVGDEKQSIYSFQGADPEEFKRMKQNFSAATSLRQVPLAISFRSTAPILQAVDAVWGAFDQQADQHYAIRKGQQGIVELWEPYFKQAQDARDRWQPPQAITVLDREKILLARHIASTIRHWLDKGEILASRGRPIRPDDILILLRNRGSGKSGFMDAIVASLKQQGLPVAGADRLRLADHLAVRDLLALARFVLNPEDDLSLACILKSPLLIKPFSEQDLIDLAAGRGPKSLWQQCENHPQAQILHSWLSLASQSPYAFFADILLRDQAYGRLISRLGSEASEPLDAFMAKCLDFERDHAPALGGFIEWMDQGASEIKRDADQGNGEIRVMTVHAAKGLEANIVILPDTHSVPDGRQAAKIYFADDGQGRLPFWRIDAGKKSNLIDRLFRASEQARQEEHARLLYVAMTRASDRLYIAAASDSKDRMKEASWYDRCDQALKPLMQETTDFAGRKIWRLQNQQTAPSLDKSRDITRIAPIAPEAFAHQLPPAETGTRWFSPSRMGEQDELRLAPNAAQTEDRFRRGQIIHTLLQFLPELPTPQRKPALERYLARPGLRVKAEEAEIIAAEVMGLLEHPDFADVFGENSLAEVALAALLDDGDALAGRIDRLVIQKEQILIVDYKTNRPPPQSLYKVPRQYLRQMAAYIKALAPLFPEKTIRAGLIWTVDARFMELPEALIQQALLDPAP